MRDNYRKSKRAVLIMLVAIVGVSVISMLYLCIASEPPDTAVITESSLEGLQQRIYEEGYSYTVAENGITRLSPEEKKALYGYKSLEKPTERLQGNVSFILAEPKAPERLELFESLPSSYDAMALGYVTPVKNQGACRSDWIFATITDFESDLLINESVEFNFAEQEVGDCNIWSSIGGYDFCEGGNDLMAINYLTKYGVADEACHPYAATSQTCQNCSFLRNVNNWRIIARSDGNELYNVNVIKNAILNYGPAISTIYASDPRFSAYNGGVYEYWGLDVPNHAVTIIGWNDSLEHSHGTGAWLIKNSWGTDWGAAGHYPGCAWVAYGSANLGDMTSAITGYQSPDDIILYHDECGWMGYVMGCGKPTAYGAVRFLPSQNATLTAVDFWAVDTDLAYEISIFDTQNVYPGYYTFSNQLGTTLAGTTNEEGYYSVPLETPVELREGDDVIVQVKFTTTIYGYPIPIDYYTDPDLPLWSAVATFSGESYGGCDGLQFVKPYDSYSGDYYDIGIRARAGLLGRRNGDVNEDGTVNFADVTYLANHEVGTPGYEHIELSIAEVNGDDIVNFADVTYLANHIVGTLGYEVLK